MSIRQLPQHWPANAPGGGEQQAAGDVVAEQEDWERIITNLAVEIRQLRQELQQHEVEMGRRLDDQARTYDRVCEVLHQLAALISEPHTRPASYPTSAASELAPAAVVNRGPSLRDVERELFATTLAATGGNRTRAAQILGVSLRTVRNKVREYGLPPRRFRSADCSSAQ